MKDDKQGDDGKNGSKTVRKRTNPLEMLNVNQNRFEDVTGRARVVAWEDEDFVIML